MRKRGIALLAVLTLCIGALAGCDNGTSKDSSSESASEAGSEVKNINIAASANITTLDNNVIDLPDDFAVVRTMQDSLYELTDEGVKEQLAESVDVSDDQKTYTFHLRDAKYSNGEPITAGDFVYSWKRLVNPDTGSEYAWFAGAAGIKNADEIAFNGGDIDTLGVEAKDDKTLVVELDHAVPYFKDILTMPSFAPINEEFGKQQGDQYGLSGENILSSGPYVVDEWVVGSEEIRLKKNDQYWNKDAIEVDTLTFKTVENEQAGILAYESGSLDIVTLSGDMVSQYQDDEALDIQLQPLLAYLYINHTNKYLENKNFRLALAYALNKEKIVDDILKDGSVAADYFVPAEFAFSDDGVAYHDEVSLTYHSYDEDLAKEYWESAKKELGKEEIQVGLLYDDTEQSKNIAQYIQSSIEDTLPGLKIELREVPYKSCWDEQKEGNFDITLSTWMADYTDPSIYFDMENSTNQYNLGKWSNEKYDELVEAAADDYATDHEKRIKAYEEAEQILLDEVGVIPVYQASKTSLVRDGISVTFAPFGNYMFRYAKATK